MKLKLILISALSAQQIKTMDISQERAFKVSIEATEDKYGLIVNASKAITARELAEAAIYLATTKTVFASTDGGKTWTQKRLNSPIGPNEITKVKLSFKN